MLVVLLLILGLGLMVKSAQLFVDGAIHIARHFKLSDLTIGVTILAIGTSLPEMVIALLNVVRGHSELVLGTVIGSSISNALLITGVAAILAPLIIRRELLQRQLPYTLGALLLLMGISAFDHQFGLIDGILLLGVFGGFMYLLYGHHIRYRQEAPPTTTVLHPVHSFLLLLVGSIGLYLGGWLASSSSLQLVEIFNVSQSLLGLTLISLGTTLPELITAIIASLKRHPDLAFGNVLGSVMFNCCAIIGISAIIHPFTTNTTTTYLFALLLGALALMFLTIVIGKKKQQIERWEGLALVCAYCLYITVVAWKV